MIVKLQYPLSRPHSHVLAYNEDKSFISEIPVGMFSSVKFGEHMAIPLLVHLNKLYVEAHIDDKGQLVITDIIEEEPTW